MLETVLLISEAGAGSKNIPILPDFILQGINPAPLGRGLLNLNQGQDERGDIGLEDFSRDVMPLPAGDPDQQGDRQEFVIERLPVPETAMLPKFFPMVAGQDDNAVSQETALMHFPEQPLNEALDIKQLVVIDGLQIIPGFLVCLRPGGFLDYPVILNPLPGQYPRLFPLAAADSRN